MGEASQASYLNCCSAPSLFTLKGVYESSHDAEAIRQCECCGAFWFYRYHEYMTFEGDDDWTVWYSPLSPDEGARILAAEDRPDLSFLEKRASFMEDREGVKQTPGQPGHPWS